jgi:16S rRNA G966 N2-methylase RsmD
LDVLSGLRKFDEQTLLKDGKIDQTMHGLSLAWTYFPHWVEVECGNNKMKPIEYWENDSKLKEIIRKTWDWQIKHGNGSFTLNRLRQNFKIYGGNQSVSNFRPSAAKYIYNTYGNGGVVWDMSCGWGGRLIGFLSSNCKRYIGTEPSTKTFNGLERLNAELNDGKEVQLHQLGSEIFKPDENSLDLCFTSPPYFDTEKYSDEETQSYKKYPSESEWTNGFLKDTVSNCFVGLKPGGKMLLNIANTPKYKTIESETIRVATEVGFKHIDTIYLILSSVSGKGEKLEPIFVFQK